MKRSRRLLAIYVSATLTVCGLASWAIAHEDRAFLLPGQTTHGHHQIELACNTCHTPLDGVKQDACTGCHGRELELADDSHPAGKFRDPRNADRLTKLNALECVTCHVEHQPESTVAMGVTQPVDYCFHCHADIAEERPSHAGMGFQTCQSAGCHNFHDNRALSEDFLAQHLQEPDNLDKALVVLLPEAKRAPLSRTDADAPADKQSSAAVITAWVDSAHARQQVNCMNCHAAPSAAGASGLARTFVDEPTIDVCKSCHADQFSSFTAGKHGMRLAQALQPMRPADARVPMKPAAADRKLGCDSCHTAHSYDRGEAAVSACLKCHDDTHSRAYEGSPHQALFQAELDGRGQPGSGVSCATCHLPRTQHPDSGELFVQHNQSDNLRPNEKMVRSVCTNCHGLSFSLDALADRALIERNFLGRPSVHVRSLDMVKTKHAGSKQPAKETDR